MSALRDAIYEALTGEDDITELLAPGVGGEDDVAVYHQEAPQEAATPYIVFFKSAGRPEWTYEDNIRWSVWTVKAVDRASDAGVAEEIDTAIDVLLNDLELDIEGFRHLYLRREGDLDYPDPDGAETYRHVGGTYRLLTQAE